MCLGGHYGYICQSELIISTDYKKAILTCEQLGYDPAGEEPIADVSHTHTQTLPWAMCTTFLKVSDSLQEKLKQ